MGEVAGNERRENKKRVESENDVIYKQEVIKLCAMNTVCLR